MKVQWSEDLAIGIGIIDDQHKKLIEKAAAFSDAVDREDAEEIERTISYLIGYCVQHFGAEELIMIRHGYDAFKEHRDEHSWFVKKVYDVNVSLMEKKLSRNEVVELRDMLVRWTLDHISIKDKRIANVLGTRI